MTLHPKAMTDLALAPVAAQVDANLAKLRDKSPGEIAYEVELQLNRVPSDTDSAEDRAEIVRELAVRDVDLHGWEAQLTGDRFRLRLSGGSVTLDLGLSPSLLGYISEGAAS